MNSKLYISTITVAIFTLLVSVSCSDSSKNEYTEANDNIETGKTLEISKDSLISGLNVEIEKLEEKLDTLNNRIKAVGGNVDETVFRAERKLKAYKESLEDQTDKVAAATEDNWADVKIEANQEWLDFKANLKETEKVIEEYFSTRTNDK